MDASDRRFVGGALATGALLMLVGVLITPGRLLIARTNALEFGASNQVLADYNLLTALSTVVAMLGGGLVLFSFVRLAQLAQGMPRPVRSLMLMGIVFVIFYFVCILAARGTYHAVVHILTQGIGGDSREQVINLLAAGLQTTGLALRYAGGTLGFIGVALFAFCVSTLFSDRIHKRLSLIIFAYSAVGFLAMLITEHLHDVDWVLVGGIYRSYPIGLLIWLIVLGAALYRGRPKLSTA